MFYWCIVSALSSIVLTELKVYDPIKRYQDSTFYKCYVREGLTYVLTMMEQLSGVLVASGDAYTELSLVFCHRMLNVSVDLCSIETEF